MGRSKNVTFNAILNTIKQCCTIIFPMITFPYVSRVLGAGNYGKVNFSLSIIAYITLIAGLGINNYAVREGAKIRENRAKLSFLVTEIYTINIISTIIAFLVLAILIILLPQLRGYGALLLIQSVNVLFITLGADWINIIYEDYLYITIRYIISHLIALVILFLLVKDKNDYLIYACTNILGTTLANVWNMLHIRRKIKIFPKFHISKNVLKHIAPIITIFCSSIASQIYINSDMTMLGIFLNDAAVGYYSVAVKIYVLVKGLANAFLYVFIPRFSYDINTEKSGELDARYNIIINAIIIIMAPSCAGLFMLSKHIILVFCGEGYLEATNSLRILSISLIFAVLACFYINVVMLPNSLEKKILIATTISAACNIFLNLILIPRLGIDAAALTTLISEIIMTALGIYYTKEKISYKIIKGIAVSVLNTLVTIILCRQVLQKVTNLYVAILFAVLLSIICFSIITFLAYRKTCKAIVSKCICKL